MRELQRRMERFFYRNRDKGIPNLMLFIVIAEILVYVTDSLDPSHTLMRLLAFDRNAILRGQVWRLFSYVVLTGYGPLSVILLGILYFRIGQIIEARCGTCKLNVYYLTGVIIIDAVCMLTGWQAGVDTFHYSLLLVFATLCPEDQMLLFFIIPIRMKYLGLVYLVLVLLSLMRGDFVSALAIVNYLIFFGSDIRNILPSLGRYHHREKRFTPPVQPGPSPNWADRYRGKDGKKPYRHKCTVCGRTDTEYPELEFRYCSRCAGYYCYCIDHINNHVHIQAKD